MDLFSYFQCLWHTNLIGRVGSVVFSFLVFTFASSCISHHQSEVAGDFSKDVWEREEFDNKDFIIEAELLIEDEVFSKKAAASQFEEDYIYHTVRGGETLMLIAFYAYTDYTRWRDIYAANRDKITSTQKLTPGMEIRLPAPLNPYSRPSGKPYLIKWGDSLSLISKKVYGQMERWPEIWKNNPKQIRDPNLIFAGFTLFYHSDDEKESLDFALY